MHKKPEEISRPTRPAGARYARGLTVLAAALACQTVPAQDKWSGYLDLEAKAGSARGLGVGDLFIPLQQDSRTLFFGNLRTSFDDHNSQEGNFGLGLRRMEGNWNLGGYAYLDHRRTANGNYFNQATLGAEALGQDWDFRANLYRPIDERVRTVGTSSTASVSGGAVVVNSITREERALPGYDLELGWRLPLFAANAARQLRVYLGGYHFEDEVTTLNGPRVRAEFTATELPTLWPGAQLVGGAEVQDDTLRGKQTFLSLRLRIPLGGRDKSTPVLTPQERRMLAPVVRDIDIVAPEVARAPVVETATALADGRSFTLIDSGTTTGANLNATVNAAGNNSVVLLSGSFNVGSNTVSLAFGQTLTSAVSVRTASGMTATMPRATITGHNISNSMIQVNAGGTVSGLNLETSFSGGGGGRTVLVADGSTNVNILNNTITMTQNGANSAVALSMGNNTGGEVRGNVLTVTGSAGAGTLTALAMNSITTVKVSGNTLSASGGTANYMAWMAGGGTTLSAGSTGNVRGNGTCNGTSSSGSLLFIDGSSCP